MRTYNYPAPSLILMTVMIIVLINLHTLSARNTIPDNCQQLILVVAEIMDGPGAQLYRFEKSSDSEIWQQYKTDFPVIIGKNGLGWSNQALQENAVSGTVKAEGDGKSPAGIFELGSAFGFKKIAEVDIYDYQYTEITQMTECIDDPASRYYNMILLKNAVDTVDWNSSEKMRRASPWYEWGVVINHNMNPTTRGAGSCIFLHNWAAPDDSTVGCTAMDPGNMLEVIKWLNLEKNPFLVQLDRMSYFRLQKGWGLPAINHKINTPVSPLIEH